jgi:hypothetical protein
MDSICAARRTILGNNTILVSRIAAVPSQSYTGSHQKPKTYIKEGPSSSADDFREAYGSSKKETKLNQ